MLQRLWNRVERQIEAAVKADAKLAQAKRRGQAPRGVVGHAGRAWRQAERLFDEAVQVPAALEQIKEALVQLGRNNPPFRHGVASAHRSI